MVDLYSRSYNPIWDLRTLTGLPLDDTYFIFFLQNEIPYQPQAVFHTSQGTPWTDPIQITAAGTMPIDVYFQDLIYRIEIRHGDTQQDELVWLIENYVPIASSISPITSVALASDNQITNPQFALVNFSTPFSLTNQDSQVIEVAPGWDLVLEGSAATVSLEQAPLSSSNPTPTGAPYALRITLNGWTSAYLRQRFDENGVLWTNKYVSLNLTARTEGSQAGIIGTLNYSSGTDPRLLLTVPSVSNTFTEYSGVPSSPVTSANTNIPPDAYTELRIHLAGAIDIYLTSIQVISSSTAAPIAYEQETVQRAIDNTFHYYRHSLLLESKQSVLAGWEFGLNPWQFRAVTPANVAVNQYTADQTIIVQQNYIENNVQNNVSVRQATVQNNYAFQVTGSTNQNRFGMIQYLDPKVVRPYWGNLLSVLIKTRAIKKTSASQLRLKCKLIYRDSLPAALSRTEPIASWADTLNSEPVLASGWAFIEAINNPTYNIVNDASVFSFNSFLLPGSTDANMTLGIMVYTIDNMDTSGDPDSILFDSISLVPNSFAIDGAPQTFDESLRRCQFYFSKSFVYNTVPATQVSANQVECINTVLSGANGAVGTVYYPVEMRSAPTGNITIYNPVNNNNQVRFVTHGDATNTTATTIGTRCFTVTYTAPSGTAIGEGIVFQWAADARLGI